jgi:enolase
VLLEAIERAGPRATRRDRARPGDDRVCSRRRYELEGEGRTLSSRELRVTGPSCARRYPIVSIEDGLAEDDWDGWAALTERARRPRAARRRRPVRHEPERLARRASPSRRRQRDAVKVNQIGTLTETLDAIELATGHGYRTVISHRSGETEDTTIADLAVATNCGPDQDGRAGALGSRRQVQPAAAHRGGARRPSLRP